MANNQNLLKGKATQFSRDNQPANRGRRPSVFAKYIKEDRVSLADIQALISSLLGYNADELQKILGNKIEKPSVGLIIMLKALTADMDSGNLDNLMTLMDRAYGKPDKTVNHEIGAIAADTLTKLNTVFVEAPETNERKPRTKRR